MIKLTEEQRAYFDRMMRKSQAHALEGWTPYQGPLIAPLSPWQKSDAEDKRLADWASHCADQEKAIAARDAEITALRQAIELQSQTIRELRAQLNPPKRDDAAQALGRAIRHRAPLTAMDWAR